MNPYEGGAPEREELHRLRERLEVLSIRHSAELDSIRSRISALEAAFIAAPEVAPQIAPEIPVSEQAPAALPPPLPKTSAFKQVKLFQAPSPVEVETPAPLAVEIPAAPTKPDEAFELDFGKVWFVRIGVVIFLTGLVFLGNYAYQNWIRDMSNGVRLTALFLCAGALAETGRRLAQKESLNRFGEVLLAGGMAFFYYCTFAAHHVVRLKVVDSPVLGAGLLFLAAGAIAGVSWLRQAKFTAAFGLLLASYATMLQPIGWMSCVSNLLLAAIGLFFMLKPGWSGPGWVSMLGGYAAYVGWQILGAYGDGPLRDERAMLWFLPPLWLLFIAPGVLGKFRETLTDRSRAWFTGVNNAWFFLLFSWMWIDLYDDTAYWQVAGVFGLILIGLGVIGRRQDTTAGGVNISQGLACITLALALKLDGHQLALVLAVESLVLAMAAWKFRARSEAVFSLLAGLGSAWLMVGYSTALMETTPIWSIALTAWVVAAASIVMVRVKTSDESFSDSIRIIAGLLLIAAALIAHHLCVFRLEPADGLVTAGLIAAGLSAVYLKLDTKRYQPESIWISLWFLGIAVWMGWQVGTPWPLSVVTVVVLAACWLWHRQPVMGLEYPSINLTHRPFLPAWAFSLAAAFFTWYLSDILSPSFEAVFLFHQIAAVVLLGVSILIRCQRLALTSALLSVCNIYTLVYPNLTPTSHLFIVVLISIAATALLFSPWARIKVTDTLRLISASLFRISGFVAYMVAWYQLSPDTWGDWVALTALVVIIVCHFLKWKLLEECVGWMVVALLWLLSEMTTTTWSLITSSETSWRGVAVILALLGLALVFQQRPPAIMKPESKKITLAIIAGITCFFIALWSTQMLVWRADWKPAAVLWTMLGFVFVSAGLWQRIHIARVSGFILLAISFGKLFVSDVWDFTAFMRVVSFIVLGATLILLGLFYNKFAPAIKALLDSEK